MLKTIAAVSPELTQFANALNLPLNVAQIRHVTQIADGLTAKDNSSNRLQAVNCHADHTQSWPDHPAYPKGEVMSCCA